MIIGVGVDIVEIDRIKKAVDSNERFLHKNFTETEIEYFSERKLQPQFIAGRFAAKEAVAKALGTGFRGFGFHDVEVIRDTLGKPMVILKGNAKEIAMKFGQYKIHLSISHSRDNAIAYVILEGDELENCNFGNNK